MSRCKLALLPAFVLLSLAAGAAPAAASPLRFGCLATPVHGTLASSAAPFDPVSLTSAPCAKSKQASSAPAASGAVRVGSAAAFTQIQQRKQAPGAGVLAAVTDFSLSGSGEQVTIAAAQAQASFACVNGAVQSSADSAVSGLTINGKAVALRDPSQTARIAIDTHGSYVLLNTLERTTASQERVAAFVHLVGVGDVTVGDAAVSQSASPCAKTTGFPASVRPCPTGADYDPAHQDCRITEFTKRPIVISAPFQGPVGVAVYSLAHARTLTSSSRCLRGRGPSYAMLGAAGSGGQVVGTRRADRILTLSGSFRISGNGGKDCISAGTGTNLITDAGAKVTIYGGTGTTTIKVGNGDDTFVLGSGTTELKAGNGDNRIQGGFGHDRIVVGNGQNHIVVPGPGIDQVTAGDGNNYIHGGAGGDRFTVGDGANTIIGGAGFEIIRAGNGNNTITAGPGIERISAGTGANVIRSAVGFDEITARGARARVTCVDRARVTVPAAAAAYARAHRCVNVIAR